MGRIKLFYYFFFNQFFKLFLWISKKDHPDVKAAVLFSGIFTLNLMTIYQFFEEIKIIPKIVYTDIQIGVFGVLIMVFNYFLFENGERYNKIKLYFEEHEFLNKPLRIVITTGFILFPFVMMFIFYLDARVVKIFP